MNCCSCNEYWQYQLLVSINFEAPHQSPSNSSALLCTFARPVASSLLRTATVSSSASRVTGAHTPHHGDVSPGTQRINDLRLEIRGVL